MVHIARLLTAAALVSVSVAAPMKARSNDNSYQQSGDNSYQPSGDNSYQQSSDNSYQQGNGNGYQQGNDNSYQQGGSYQQGSDNSYQQDGSYQQGSDNSYQSSSSYDNSYQTNSDNSYQTSSDNSYQTNSDNNYQTSSDYATSSSYDNSYSTSTMEDSSTMMDESSTMMDESSTMMMESTMTTSSEYAYSTPSYGSGNQNWGQGYNDCVMQCAANNGMPSGMYYPPTQTASESSMYGGETGSNGVTHTIVVAPTQGVFRYMPFATNASVGDTVEFYWANGEHTVTSSSAVEVCTKNDQGGLDSGKKDPGFQYSMVVNDDKPKWFYCGVADHCKQGMFGGININQPNPDAGDYMPVRDVLSNMTQGNNDMAAMWQYTKQKTGDDAYANGWGMGINVAGMDEVAMGETMKNVMWMQTLIAANPDSVDPAKGFQVTSKNMTIPGDLGKALAATGPSTPGAGNAAASPGSPAASGSDPAISAAATNPPTGKNGAASVASSSIATVFVAVAACFFLL